MSDGPKVYRDEIRKAYKNYECCECNSLIAKGERYHIFTGLWDDWSSYRSCPTCNELRAEVDFYSQKHGDELCNFGSLYHYVFDGENKNWMKKFVDNMIFRGNVPPDWMKERLQQI